jgi:hypothetical protein
LFLKIVYTLCPTKHQNLIKLSNCLFTIILFSINSSAQPKEFEGIIVYKAEAKSKLDGVNEQTILVLAGTTDTVVTYIKQGHYFHSSKLVEQYYLPKEERIYIRYKGVDSLYYIPYSHDTSTIISVSNGSDHKTIAGYDCQSISIKTVYSTTKFFYNPLLYANPEYSKNLSLGHLNLFVQKTQSVWLANEHDQLHYTVTQAPLLIESKKIDDQVFKLPALPVTKFRKHGLVKLPEFTGEEKTWSNFIRKYTNADLAAKYLKFKKGQDTVQQVVYVGFVVSPEGEVINTKVLNPKEVHPKLGAEAVEVIELSDWKPGLILGRPVNFPLVQPIVFAVVKE